MKKRLFAITDRNTRKHVEGLYFDDKKKAKAKRRELNGYDPETDEPESLRYIVSPGPDHHRSPS